MDLITSILSNDNLAGPLGADSSGPSSRRTRTLLPEAHTKVK